MLHVCNTLSADNADNFARSSHQSTLHMPMVPEGQMHKDSHVILSDTYLVVLRVFLRPVLKEKTSSAFIVDGSSPVEGRTT